VTLGAYEHQEVPFEKLVEELRPERSLSHTPLFQVMFALQNMPQQEVAINGLRFVPVMIPRETAKFDLSLFVHESADGRLQCAMEYSTDLFDEARVKRMLTHLDVLLTAIVADPRERISQLALVTDSERQQLLGEWNQTQALYPQDKCIHELFEEQVRKSPTALALVYEEEHLSYEELNQRANQVAHYLRGWGVGPDILVGLCMERSIEMVVALLGVLKAGGAYVPLDPSYPKQRLKFMIENTNVSVLITQQHLLDRLPEQVETVVCLDRDRDIIADQNDADLNSGASADNLAYIIYTSGSTGTPKGVCVTQRAVVRLVKQTNYINLAPDQVILQFAPLSFDASTFEIWGALLNGARLVLFPAHKPSLEELGRAVEEYKVTTLWLTAGLFHQMVESHLESLKNLTQLLAGGDVLSVGHVERVSRELKGCTLINGYGPTENTTFTCCYKMMSGSRFVGASVPIGRPIANTQVYLLSDDLNPVAVGEIGELYTGGDGLARGYLAAPDLTAEKFIPNPFSQVPGGRLYKTGDRARYRPDGSIEFLGRIDQQVKIRGFRIELGEIEATLETHPDVRAAVAVAREDSRGDKQLIAYIVPNSEHISSDWVRTNSELRSFLKQKLPDYMIPQAFVMLGELPLNPNGKVDRKALPPPDRLRSEDMERAVATPHDPLEAQLIEIWEDLLGVKPISKRDNFFDLGGHSMLAVRLIDRIEQTYGKKLPLATLYSATTVERLAEALLSREREILSAPVIKLKVGSAKHPFFFLHGDINGGGFYSLNLARHLDDDQPFYVLPPHVPDGHNDAAPTIEAMALSHLKTLRSCQPEGPYLIGGYCNGGLVAFEMARLLRAQGQKVDLLVLLDTSAANVRFKFLQNLISYSGRLMGLEEDEQRIWFIRWRNLLLRLRKMRRSEQVSRVFALTKRSCKRVGAKLLAPIAPNLIQSESSIPYFKVGPENGSRHQNKINQIYAMAVSGYVPNSYSGKVSLFLPTERLGNGLQAWIQPWQKVSAEVEIHFVPGDHMTSLTQFSRVLGERLNACLRAAQEGERGSLTQDAE
jgi:aspartate racemase